MDTIVVRTEADLREILQKRVAIYSRQLPRVMLRTSTLSESETRRWEGRLETLRQECGCTTGAFAMMAFALAFIAYALHDTATIFGNSSAGGFAIQATLFVAGLIASAVAGKIAGRLWANVRFRRACAELQSYFRRSSDPTSNATCIALLHETTATPSL